MPVEIELKLRLLPDKVAGLRRNSLLKSLTISRPVTQKLYTVYYDTSNFDLRRNDIAFRLRRSGRSGKRWIQSIKGGGSVTGGLHQRYEWETPVPEAQPDFSKIDDAALAKLFGNADLREQLRPLFTTEFKRSIRILRLPDGSEAEFSLDQGLISAPDGSSMSICEIELELKSGSHLPLYQLALDLLSTVPLRLENTSKAERGYALVTGYKSPPLKVLPVQLTGEMNMSKAFKAIARNCLGHLHGNEAGMLEYRNAEYLHQMRVALRRIRLVLIIFAKAFAKPAFASVTPELKWLSAQLGPARDWDVFVSGTLAVVSENFPQHAGLLALRKKCEQIRREQNDRAYKAVDSTRYTELMLKLGAYLSAESRLVPAKPPLNDVGAEIRLETPVKEFADTLLSRGQAKLKKYSKKLKKLDAAELHALRIVAKKQRYASEFFAKLYVAKKAKRYIKSLAELQGTLGTMNDASVAERLLSEVPIEKAKSGEHEAIGIVRGWVANVALTKKSELDKVWVDFEKNDRFWQSSH
jgi:triphosphatase